MRAESEGKTGSPNQIRRSTKGLHTLQKFLELVSGTPIQSQLGHLFQKQKIKGSLWNLCAVYAGLKNSAGGIAKPTDGRGTALSQALVSLELDMAIRRALSWMFEPAIRWSNLRASASACMEA